MKVYLLKTEHEKNSIRAEMEYIIVPFSHCSKHSIHRQKNGRPMNDGRNEVAPPSPWLFGNIQLAVSMLIALICAIALSCWYFFGGYQSHQATIVIVVLGLLLIVVTAVFSCCAFVHLSRVKRVLQQQRDVEHAEESLVGSPLTYDESAKAVHLRV
jgi:hypothetical protein